MAAVEAHSTPCPANAEKWFIVSETIADERTGELTNTPQYQRFPNLAL